MTDPFTRRGDEVVVRLDRDTRDVLAALPELLTGSDDTRLSYLVHRDNPAAEQRYRELVGESLDELRDGDRAALMRSVGETVIAADDAEAWMRVIGEARLVLAARLGIEHDGWEDEADPAHNPEMALLTYLGYLQDRLVAVL